MAAVPLASFWTLPELNLLVIDGVAKPEALRAANPRYIEAGHDVRIDPIVSSDQSENDGQFSAEVSGAEHSP